MAPATLAFFATLDFTGDAADKLLFKLVTFGVRFVVWGERRPGHLARCKTGGGEWESNPPETGSLPHSDLKSERPTGDDSPPLSSPD
jgi:hypothetical protein